MARRRFKPPEEILSGAPVDAETLTQVRQVEAGSMPGYAATSPAAKRRAAELAAEGARPVLEKRVADASAMAQIRANTRQANGLTPQQELEAGYGTGQSHQPAPAKTKASKPQTTMPQVPGQPQGIGYWTPQSALIPPRPDQPNQPTARQYATALSMPVPVNVTGMELMTTARNQSFMHPERPNEVIDPGQIVQTADGQVFRNDAQAGVFTPVVWDAGSQGWQTAEELLEARAKDDPHLSRQYQKIKADRLAISAQVGDGIDDDQERQALAQVDQQMMRLAKGASTMPQQPSLEQQFKQDTVTTPHGVFTMTDRGWDKIADPPDDENEKRMTQYQKGWLDVYKGLKTKDLAGNEHAPDVAEVEKVMGMMRDSYAKFNGQQGQQGQGAGTGAQMPAGGVTQEDLEFTAKKYGISVDEVKKRIGMK